ncbi:MAG: guanine deaminase [Vampirovibrionales bacterium]|nr:guanine deaminase [Vampirovibrionales bacterium]
MPTFSSPFAENNLKPTAYQGAILHSIGKGADDIAYYPDGLLLVNARGQIDACGDRLQLSPQIDLSVYTLEVLSEDQVLMPGMIDLHTHLPQYHVRGKQEKDLLSWLGRHIFPEEAKFSDPAYAKSVSDDFFKALLQNGTTTACVFLTSHRDATDIAFESAQAIGNRVVMGLNLMDTPSVPDAYVSNASELSLLRQSQELLLDTEALCRKWHGRQDGRLRYAWMPRFALSCTETLLSATGDLRAKYPDVYFHTHLSEQPGEVEAVLRRFPWASDYTEVYDKFDLLGSHSILAHGVHLSDSELELLKKTQSGLAHCPGSNFFLKSGRFPLARVMEKNLRFGLGSDVGAGPELSIFKAMRDAQYRQDGGSCPLPLNSLFYAATLGAARVLHLEATLGNFLPGKWADFIVLHVPLAVSGPIVSSNDILSAAVYLLDERHIIKSAVSGKVLYQRG